MDKKSRALVIALELFHRGGWEGLGIGAYILYKTASWSSMTSREILVLVLYLAVVRFGRWSSRTILGREVLSAAKDFDKLVGSIMYTDFWPHHLIQWLTKGRFDSNIACKEKITFQGHPCQREACRFNCTKTLDTPDAIWSRIPLRTKLGRCIHLGPRREVLRGKSLGPQGRLIGWNAHGITFRMPHQYWNRIQKDYGGDGPIKLTAYIRFWLRLARLRIEPHRSRSEGDDVVVFGRFQSGYPFDPAAIRKHPSKWISIPICDAIQKERKPKIDPIYTPVPAVTPAD